MVLLTITPLISEGLQTWSEIAHSDKRLLRRCDADPDLDDAAVGKPISHGQVIDLWTTLRDANQKHYTLERLLQGSRVYTPPPPPKPEPSDEYKALMARLRREEEERAYERMTNPPSALETFAQRFPNHQSKLAQSFAEANRPVKKDDLGDDEVTYDEVHRQLMLILNFLVSIFGVAATLWVLARWWSTPARVFLALGGSILVGIAEVGVYSGYVWHLGQAKKKEKQSAKAFKEVKQVVQTWVVGTEQDEGQESKKLLSSDSKPGTEDGNLRRRRVDESR